MSHKSEQVRHTVCSPGACSSSGHWELTGHSRQAGESALRGALAVLPPPTCAGPLRLCLANSKPDAMHTRTKESTDKDNFFFWGGVSASLPGSPAPPLPSPVLLQPSPSSPLHWLFPHLDALQQTAGPKFRPQLLWRPPPTPSSPPLRLSLGLAQTSMVPMGISGQKDIRPQKHTV